MNRWPIQLNKIISIYDILCVKPSNLARYPTRSAPRPLSPLRSNGFAQSCTTKLTPRRTKRGISPATAACVYDHPPSSLASERQSAPFVWITTATHAIILTVRIAVLCWMDNQPGIMCCDNSSLRKLEMHSPLTCAQNRPGYYEQGSRCSLQISRDLITITTVYFAMMIIRAIAEMKRVLFQGMSLPLWVTPFCTRLNIGEWKKSSPPTATHVKKT